MLLPNTFKDITVQAEQKNLFLALVRQLNIDFTLANTGMLFSETITETELQITLCRNVLQLVETQFDVYLNVLYCVDVSEQKLKEYSAIHSQDIAKRAAFLILQRVWQKVWYKAKYRR